MNRPIGVFDSGVGGLSIVSSLAQSLPHQNLIYVAANKYMPFGQKTVHEIQQISERVVRFLIEKHQVKLVVIACNTATVTSIDYLRSRFDIPFVGVVPVVKPACATTKTNCVAILSTPVTASSDYLHNLIATFGKNVSVINIGCPGLADLIETGQNNSTETYHMLESLVAPALKQGADVFGLCSTHYSFIRKQLQAITGPNAIILDAIEPVTHHVVRVLSQQEKASAFSESPAEYTFYATKNAEHFQLVGHELIGNLISSTHLIEL